MSSKRRLSSGLGAGAGGSLLGAIVDDDDVLGNGSETTKALEENEGVGFGASGRRNSMIGGGSRRRSSFGGSRAISSEEQARIADMYKTVIKLSTENVR